MGEQPCERSAYATTEGRLSQVYSPIRTLSPLSLTVFLVALLSAVLHAIWNAATRTRPDPGTAYAAVIVMAGVVSIPIILIYGLPGWEVWPYATVATLINLVTTRLIMATHRLLPFSVAYPVTRGISPVVVTLAGVVLLGDRIPNAITFAGILLISIAVMLLAQSGQAQGEKVNVRGLLLALASGVGLALFTLLDARGARLSGNAIGYAAMMAIIIAVSTPVMLAFEGVWPKHFLKGNVAFGLGVSVISTLSYILAVWGLTHGPVGPVAALRETSVLFAMAIAALMLKEKPGWRRILAAFLAVAGIGLIRLA